MNYTDKISNNEFKTGVSCMICDKFVELTEEELSKIKNGYDVYKICNDCKNTVLRLKYTNTK